MNKFLTSNDALYRTLRTVLQGIIGVLISYTDVLVASLTIPDTLRPIIVALCMAILSPIMAELGRATEKPVDTSYLITHEVENGEDSTRNEE